jgi:hypothetical protein
MILDRERIIHGAIDGSSLGTSDEGDPEGVIYI